MKTITATRIESLSIIAGITLSCILFSLSDCSAQSVTRDKDGNFKSIAKDRAHIAHTDSLTTYTFTDAKGIVWPVYVGGKGSFYIGRISAKSGKYYRQYLKEEQK